MSRANFLVAALVAIVFAPDPSWAAGSNKVPVVKLTAPTAGQVFTLPTPITLTATATDANGVNRVEFYRNTTLIGTDTTAPYSMDWLNPPLGTYNVSAWAIDNLGAIGFSPSASITVLAPASALITSPANNAALYGSSVTVSGTFNGNRLTTAVIADNGNTSRMAVPTSNNFSVSLPLLRGPNTITVTAARNDKTFDTYSITVTGHDVPFVGFRSPAAGAHEAPASLELEAEALSPAGSISRVEFRIDGALRATDTSAPYQYTWLNPPFGNHTLTARAYDNNNVTATDTRSVTINTPNTLPNVALTAPADGAMFQQPATILLQATASDPDGSISRVEFLRNGTLLGSDTTAPYSFNWTNVQQGSYSITARAIDNRSGATLSAPANITVTPPNVPPTVSLDAPVNGEEFTSPANITLAASAADSDGAVMWVEFYAGTTLLGTDSSPPYNYAWNGVFGGTYALRARAIDNVGRATDSAIATIAVVDPPPNEVPTASVSGSAADAYGPTTITLSASAADSDGTVAKVDLYANGSVINTDTTAPYEFVWNDVAAGSYAFTAVATDNLGATASSNTVTITVKALQLNIGTPSNGVLLVGTHTLIAGTLDAPFNSGVTINGVPAALDDEGARFWIDLPLAAGENTITARLTTQDGRTVERIISVTSDGEPRILEVTPERTEVVAPRTREVHVQEQHGPDSHRLRKRVLRIQHRCGHDCRGDGFLRQLHVPLRTGILRL